MNIFDFVIVLSSMIEMFVLGDENSEEGGESNAAISAFRSLRILRALRSLRTLKVLRVSKILRSMAYIYYIIQVVATTIQSFIYVGCLLILLIFIYSLIGMNIYGGKFNFPDKPSRQNFDNIGNAFVTVF